ncbi:MAG: hydrogenase nickel incorporation protein HypB [Candidatus Melainabacteria bacterium]|jgi:hydrogenase nickel incorporation protein HypB|nr:hydrogenase nickel incorporation protein HypB [Candidatus Melainabacteria bacterium]
MHESADEHALERILGKNDEMADHNREHFRRSKTCVFNVMSAPGAGKTTVLEWTFRNLDGKFKPCVIEGDMVGNLDADRIAKTGTPVYQISTGRSCHLDAQMITRLLHSESVEKSDTIFIENVGNLVCPAEFPLGEYKRIVLLSITEGDDKPIKYPVIFRNCDLVLLTKCDLMEHVDFSLEEAEKRILAINPNVLVMHVSAKTGYGMEKWLAWIVRQISEYQSEIKKIAHVHHSAH